MRPVRDIGGLASMLFAVLPWSGCVINWRYVGPIPCEHLFWSGEARWTLVLSIPETCLKINVRWHINCCPSQ